MHNIIIPILLVALGVWRFCRCRFSSDPRTALPGGSRMSDAQLRLMEMAYDVRRMRLLESYTSLVTWLLCALWAYFCFCTEVSFGKWYIFFCLILIEVIVRVILQVRWARRTPDEQTAYMRDNNIDLDALNETAAASRTDAADQQSEQKSILRLSALWAIPVAVVFFLLIYALSPSDYFFDESGFQFTQTLTLIIEDYIVAFCMTVLVIGRIRRKK